MWARVALLAASAAWLVGCNTVAGPVEAGSTVFEVEYGNWAWFATNYGFVIDSAGTIHKWDLKGKPWSGADDDRLSPAELEAKWSAESQQTGTVGSDVVQQMAARVAGAAAGPLSSPVNRCADAGVITYSAYRYDADRGVYRRVVLRREGDTAQLNQSADGRAIADWLMSLALVPRMEGCQP